MSNKKEREKRREERIQEEAKVEAGDRRTKLLQLGAGTVFLAIVVVVVLIVANSGGSSGGDANNLKEIGTVDKLLSGIPQRGLELGQANAKVQLYEYGDLQCPVCKAYSEEVLPQVIDNKIKTGKAKIEFRNFTIIGPQSPPAGAAALAAGAQGRGWNYLELWYRNQGKENSGYATDEFMTAIAKGAAVPNIAKWNKERNSAKFKSEVTSTTEQAQKFGFTGTPSFAIEGPKTKGIKLLGTPGSAGPIEEAIEEAS